MAEATRTNYTAEEYLALEEQSGTRAEFLSGRIFRMEEFSPSHTQIAGNLYIGMRQALDRRSCRLYIGDMRLLVAEIGLYTYPDLMAVCGAVEFAAGRTDTITNPILIVEILSNATRDYDRASKFAIYRHIPTLQEYISIDQDSYYAEHSRRIEDGQWLLETLEDQGSVLGIESLGIDLPLASIYDRVSWTAQVSSGQARTAI